MGSSSKKKKDKKKDFQKPKLKVGKAKPKPDNQTNTQFRAKAIILNQQSLNVSAPSVGHQFQHHLSLLSSRADAQRKESLAYLTTFITNLPVNQALPVPSGGLLDKVLPLMLDGNPGVRTQLLRLLQSLKHNELKDHAVKLLPYIRAGMTHLSRDIRVSTIDTLSWIISVAGEEVVSSPGGWKKTLESFITLLGWNNAQNSTNWTANKVSFAGETKSTARSMQVLDSFLRAGLDYVDDNPLQPNAPALAFPLWQSDQHHIPLKSNPFAQLKIFGGAEVDHNQILEDREDRLEVFKDSFEAYVTAGILATKQEGGELGRAAGLLAKTLHQAEIKE